MRRKNRCFYVTLDIPEGASEEDVMDYLADAVKSWAGALFPGSGTAYGEGDDSDADPMFSLNRDSVRVGMNTSTRAYKRRKAAGKI